MTLIEGISLMALGTVALAWPNVSIVVLAVLVGVFFIVFGVFSFVGGLYLLDLHHVAAKAGGETDKSLKDKDDAITDGLHHHAA